MPVRLSTGIVIKVTTELVPLVETETVVVEPLQAVDPETTAR